MVTAPGADQTSKLAALDLSRLLGRVAYPSPAVGEWDPSSRYAIRIGSYAEWAAFDGGLPPELAGSGWDFAIFQSGETLYVLGRDPRGARLGAAKLLRQLGYAKLGTNPNWEITPTVGVNVPLPADVPATLAPSLVQGLGSGFLMQDDQPKAGNQMTSRLDDWQMANGLFSDGQMTFGHAFAAIKAFDPASFTAHPEYLAGAGEGTKFCLYESGLRTVILNFLLSEIDDESAILSLSASDGSTGWTSVCSGTNEQATHSPSDRMVDVCNYEIGQLRALGKNVRLGLLAYGDTAAPPTLTVDSDIVIAWATGFVVGGLTPEQVRDGWIAKGVIWHLPYSYANIWQNVHDLPGKGRASSKAELLEEITRATTAGAMGWSGEGVASWAPYGRWYFALAGLMLGEDCEARWDTYPAIAFPSAPVEAASWYDFLASLPVFSSDLVHQLGVKALALLDAVEANGGSAREVARALDLARYAIYSHYMRAYISNPSATTYEPLLLWKFRIRELDLVAYKADYDEPDYATDRKAVAAVHSLSDLNEINAATVFADTATTESEIRTLLATVISANPAIPFPTRSYSDNYVHATALTHPSTIRGAFTEQTGNSTGDLAWWYQYHTGDVLTIKAGVVNTTQGPAHFRIYENAGGATAYEIDVTADGTTNHVTGTDLPALNLVDGRWYRIEVTNAKVGVVWSWTHGAVIGVPSTSDTKEFTAAFSGFFYVDAASAAAGVLGFYAQSGTVRIFDPTNTQILQVSATSNFYSVAITQPGVYKFTGPTSILGLLTCSPIWAEHPSELPVPLEVAIADGLAYAA